MKKTITVILFLCLANFLKGQDITFSIAPTLNNIYHYNFVAGGPSGNYKTGFYASVESIKIKERGISFGYGLSFQESNVEIVPEPFIGGEIHTETVYLISGNLKVLKNLRREYYFSLDPFLDLQLKSPTQSSIDNQTGIGLSFGLGKKIILNRNLYLNIEPTAWIHNVVPFVDNNLPFRLTIIGLKAGITIRKD